MQVCTLEEREDLVRRSGGLDLLDFVERLKWLRRKYHLSHLELLAIELRASKPTTLPTKRLLHIRQQLAEEGREYTPKQVKRLAESLCQKLRNNLRDAGYLESEIPEDDVELLKRLS